MASGSLGAASAAIVAGSRRVAAGSRMVDAGSSVVAAGSSVVAAGSSVVAAGSRLVDLAPGFVPRRPSAIRWSRRVSGRGDPRRERLVGPRPGRRCGLSVEEAGARPRAGHASAPGAQIEHRGQVVVGGGVGRAAGPAA